MAALEARVTTLETALQKNINIDAPISDIEARVKELEEAFGLFLKYLKELIKQNE